MVVTGHAGPRGLVGVGVGGRRSVAPWYVNGNDLLGSRTCCRRQRVGTSGTGVTNAQERVALGNIHSLAIVTGEKSQQIRRPLDIK